MIIYRIAEFLKIAKFGDMVKTKYLQQGINLETIDLYIQRFDVIRKRKDKELFADIPNVKVPKDKRQDIGSYTRFKDLELVVDYVRGQKQITPKKESESTITPIYENDDLSIYRGLSPQECIAIRGGLPYTWCVAAVGTNNLYNTYRFQPTEPTFYFVKSKKPDPENKYNFFVIQVTKDNGYIVTSNKNDGDIRMAWDKILKINPSLQGLENIFKNIPLTAQEKDSYNKFRNNINELDFAKLPYEDKRMFVDLVGYKYIDTPKFKLLPDDLKSRYIDLKQGLTKEMFDAIKDNQQLLKRFKQITERKLDESEKNKNSGITFTNTEVLILDKVKRDELIKNMSKSGLVSLLKDTDKKNEIIEIMGPEGVNKLTDRDINELCLSDFIFADIVLKYKDKNSLSSSNISTFLRCTNNPEDMAKKLGQANIDRLDISDIPELLTSSNILTIKEMANILGKKNINKLTDDQVLSLTKTYEDLMVPVLLQYKRENLSDTNISNLLQYSTANNKSKIIDVVLQEKGKNLTPNQSNILIIHSPNKEETCKNIIKYIGKDNLDPEVIVNAIFYAVNKDDMAKILGPKNIAKMTSSHWERLMAHPNSDKLQVTKLMLQYTGANLSDAMIIQLLHNTKDKEMMAKMIIDNKGSNLTSPSVFHILQYVSNPEIFATMMGPENINKLTDNNIRNLLSMSRDKIRMQKALASHRLFNKSHVAPPMAPQTMPQKTPSINVKQIPQKKPSINVKQKTKNPTNANSVNWYKKAQGNP